MMFTDAQFIAWVYWPLMYLALAVYVPLQVFDLWSTNRILKGGGIELNPYVAWVQKHLGGAWWIPRLGVPLGAISFGLFAPAPLGLWVILLAPFYFMEMLDNWRVVRRNNWG